MTTMRSTLPPWVMMIAVWAVVFAGMRLLMNVSRRKHTGRIVESLLRIGRCPSCGYDLRACTPEHDGVCVCPECSAAWRHQRIGNAPVPRADLPTRPDSPGDTPSILGVWKRLLRRTPTIVDDRNRSVPRVGLDVPGVEQEIGAEPAAALRRTLARATVLRRYGCAAPVALVGVLIVIGSGAMFLRNGAAFFSVLSLCFAIWMALVYGSICWRMIAGRLSGTSNAIVRVLRLARICPGCAAYLGALAPEEDGCVLCPRCSAAWKFETLPAPINHESTRKTTSV